MQAKGYLIFHLNLAFSSIEEEKRPEVIQQCYEPLLDLIEKTGIPIGIELTGWTLQQIEQIDPKWIKRFKTLLNNGSCELIGSGYCQIIGPLVPHSVNVWNQKLGLLEYQRILGIKPTIALVNEMAYSCGLVELYALFGYQGLIMDRDNVRLALELDHLPLSAVPTHAKGMNDSVLPVLWADSILFQKMQHYAHGDNGLDQYLSYLNKRLNDGDTLLPIYCNDAEVFDYRPGRFKEERATHPDGEWSRIENLLNVVSRTTGLEWISPSTALQINHQCIERIESRLTSGLYPIPVKKQKKYNIARWAVTGRNDLWLNSLCHRIAKSLQTNANENPSDWRELCELWSSDFRTHITHKRWHNLQKQLKSCLIKHNLKTDWEEVVKPSCSFDRLETVIGKYGAATISLENEGIFLRIVTAKIEVVLNLRRGLTIHRLSFISHGLKPCVGTIPHGYFTSIDLGADFYSGGVIIELPNERTRITDLEQIEPVFSLINNESLEIHATIPTFMGDIKKNVRISLNEEQISLQYAFPNWKRPIGSLRLGIMTLLPEFFNGFSLSCVNGGKSKDIFNFDSKMSINQGRASSTIVSSTTGLGATEGNIQISNKQNNIQLNWNPGQCAVMPMIQHEKGLTRIYFSMLETDETSKESSSMGSFALNIAGSKKQKM